MSDIPELDRIIEEADNARFNNEWTRRDRFFRRSVGSAFICLLLTPVLGLLFGDRGVVVACIAVVLAVAPLFALAMYTILHECFTDPAPRDPSKRYKYM